MKELTQEYLRSILHYDPETGFFTWLVNTTNTRIGRRAGNLSKVDGRWIVTINGRKHKASRLAWFYMTGRWPLEEVDHKDTNQLNNKFDNLREASRSQNELNKRGWASSGFRGVYRNRNRWVAQIVIKGTACHVGSFLTKEEAHAARLEIAKQLHGEFCYGAVKSTEYDIPEIKQMHLIPDMEPIEFPQMMLSFGG